MTASLPGRSIKNIESWSAGCNTVQDQEGDRKSNVYSRTAPEKMRELVLKAVQQMDDLATFDQVHIV